jgi:hypothetical protein
MGMQMGFLSGEGRGEDPMGTAVVRPLLWEWDRGGACTLCKHPYHAAVVGSDSELLTCPGDTSWSTVLLTVSKMLKKRRSFAKHFHSRGDT